LQRKRPGITQAATGLNLPQGWMTLSPLPAQPEPKHLPRLKTEIMPGFGTVDLLDMLNSQKVTTVK
jgi:hypothetical protein